MNWGKGWSEIIILGTHLSLPLRDIMFEDFKKKATVKFIYDRFYIK